MKNRGKKGLIKVLLTDRKKLLESYSNNVFDIEFFQNYFNEDCEKYVRYVLDNKLIEDKDEVEELAESVGCENILLKILYEEDSQYVVNLIKGQFRYDIVDDGRLILDKDDLGILFDNEYYKSILDDGGIFDDWYPDVLMNDIEEALNEEEKSILAKLMNKETFDFNDLKEESDLIDQLENIYGWAIRQAGEDEINDSLMKNLQEYFKTKDIIFDHTTKGELILSINVKNFLEDIVFDYFTDGIHEDVDILADCSNFVCFIEHMIDYHNHYTKIQTPYLDYFYPDHRTIEDLFHEYFSQEIG